MENDDSLDQEESIPDFDNRSWKIELEEKYYLFTRKVYLHPYFTYHIDPPDHYQPDHYVSGSEVCPYTIPIRTISEGDLQVYPEDLNEDFIKDGFCFYIKRHEPAEIPLFLNYQYEHYLKFSEPHTNPEGFLDYIITTIENFKDQYRPNWRAEDYWNLKAVATWVRNHPGYTAAFDLRLKNWINIGVGFQEVIDNHKEYYYQKFFSFIYANGPDEIPAKLEKDFRASINDQKPGDNPLQFFYGIIDQLKRFLPLNYKMKDSTFLSLRAVGEWLHTFPGTNEQIKKWSDQWLTEIGTYELFIVKKGRATVNQGDQEVISSFSAIQSSFPNIGTVNNKAMVAEMLRHFSGHWRARQIMSMEDYQKLLDYVHFLVENHKPQPNIVPIKINFPVAHVRATFVNLYDAVVNKTSERKVWVDFLCAAFPEKFSEKQNKSTTLKKFYHTQNPDTYDVDILSILKNLGK